MKEYIWVLDLLMLGVCMGALFSDRAATGKWDLWIINCAIWVIIARLRG
jgi:hypothetical protein